MKPSAEMLVSPYDRSPLTGPAALVQLQYNSRQRWVSSRFNARTVSEDGRLMLWNTLTGAMSIFDPSQADGVLACLTQKGVKEPLDKFGRYLGKRGFLVRDGVNEMDLFRMRFAKQHWRTDTLEFILLASEDCNFRCVYCYEKFKHGTMEPWVRDGIRSMISQRAAGLKELAVAWFGGEPLYGWEAIEDLGPFIRSTVDTHGLRFRHHMTTNAYLLTEERATKLLDWGCNDYQITLDGLAADHDCKRVGRDGSPTYGVILDNLRSMHQRSAVFRINLRINYDRLNFPRLAPFLEALSEDFSGDPRFEIHFHAVGKWGGQNDEHLQTCGRSEQRQVVNDLRAKAKGVGLRTEGGVRAVANMGSQVCYAGRPYHLIVGATGKLMKCTILLDDNDANIVGQLHPDGTTEISEEKMIRWVAPHFESDSLCQTCYVLPGCQGSACPLTRVTSNERSCCGVKSDLKREMRFTMEEAAMAKQQRDPQALAGAGA